MVMNIGNGRSTSLWFDNWSNIGILSNLVMNENWNWPIEWNEKFSLIAQLQAPMLEDQQCDRLTWEEE